MSDRSSYQVNYPKEARPHWQQAKLFFASRAALIGLTVGPMMVRVMEGLDPFISGSRRLPAVELPDAPVTVSPKHSCPRAIVSIPFGWGNRADDAVRKFKALCIVEEKPAWKVWIALAAYYKEHLDELPIREAVGDGNSRKVSYFPKHPDPMNEPVSLGKQPNPALAERFPLILDKRSQIKGNTEKGVAIKERMRHTTATHRRLMALAVQIETAKLRRKLSEDEKKELLARRQKEWVVKRATFYSTRVGYKSRTEAYDAANAEIEDNLRTELIRIRSAGLESAANNSADTQEYGTFSPFQGVPTADRATYTFALPKEGRPHWQQAKTFFKSRAVLIGLTVGPMMVRVMEELDPFISGGRRLPAVELPDAPATVSPKHSCDQAVVSIPFGWGNRTDDAVRKFKALCLLEKKPAWEVWVALAAYYKEHLDELPQ